MTIFINCAIVWVVIGFIWAKFLLWRWEKNPDIDTGDEPHQQAFEIVVMVAGPIAIGIYLAGLIRGWWETK